jgi:uncharacterized protein DUF4238/SEC-C motif-containing protein
MGKILQYIKYLFIELFGLVTNSTIRKEKELVIVKNQHYIPQALIRCFADENMNVFEVLLKSKKIYQTNTRNVMSEKFTYEHEGLSVNTIENYFAKIEADMVPKIKSIIEKINKYKPGDGEFLKIKEDVDELLPIFVIFYYRSGAVLREFSSIKKEDKIPLLSEKILNHDYINNLSESIKKCYKFAIIKSNDEFLMSDQYISTAALKIKARFDDRSNRHIGLRETMIMIPLSSSYYAVYWHSDDRFIVPENSIEHLDGEYVNLINKAIINNSYNKCLSKRKEKISQVLGSYRMRYPSHIYKGYESGYISGAILKKEVFFYDEEREVYDMFEFSGFTQYKDLGRNDNCACGSGKKFKKCHNDAYTRCKVVMASYGKSCNQYLIPGVGEIELPIDQWSGYAKNKLTTNK